jgi:N-acetylglucosamine-6-phosphate deacetylase
MGRLLLHGALLLDPEGAAPEPGALLLEGERIAARLRAADAVPEDALRVDLGGLALAPGFLDLHHHGRVIFSDAARIERALLHDASELMRHGTTAFLATTISSSELGLRDLVAALARGIEAVELGARPIGIHLEGPWINPLASGAHAPSAIRGFDPREGDELWSRAAGRLRMVTLAPELPAAGRLIDQLARAGVLVALGHSLASAGEVDLAVDRGARHVTHLFNAMGPLHHRAPGLAGATLADDRLSCDLICDGVHVDPRLVSVAARAKRDRLILITDRLDPPGDDPRSAPVGFEGVRDDGAALWLPDGRLAGSRLELAGALRNAQRLGGMTRLDAIAACTLRPARALGIESERGTLRPGARADLVLLDGQDRVRETWIAGVRAYAAEASATASRG